MTIALVLIGVALAISLAFNLGLLGGKSANVTASHASNQAPARAERRDNGDEARKVAAELDKKSKELSELKKQHSELKDELKGAKKKLFDATEANKSEDDLVKARGEAERAASIQLDATRAELAQALAELTRVKADAENKGRRRPAPEKPEEKQEAPKPQEVITRVIRELSDVEKERIARLETQSANDRKKANELDRELKSVKVKFDRHQREAKRVYQDAQLARDKFRAVELRLNRTTMENDLLKRAIRDLEKKAGVDAGRLDLTAEEAVKSDEAIKAKHAAEDAAEAEALARLEAAPATSPDEAPATEAPAATEPAATTETPTAQA